MKPHWQKIQIVCSVLCIMVYAAATLYASILIYRAAHTHDELTYQEYFELKDVAATAGVLGWTRPSFRDDILEAVSLSKTLQAVIISGPDDYAITVEKIPGIIKWNGRKPHFDKGIHILKKLQSTPLRFDGQSNLTISAVATYIDFNNLLFILRKALLAILAAVVLSFTMLIANIMGKKTPDRKKTHKINEAETKLKAKSQKPAYFYPDDYDRDSEDAETADAEDAPFSNASRYEDSIEDEPHKKTDGADSVDMIFEEDAGAEESSIIEELPWGEPEELITPKESREDEQDLDDEPYEESTQQESVGENEYESDIFGLFDQDASFADELAPELEKAEEAEQELSLMTAVWVEDGASASILTETAMEIFKPGSLITQKPAQGIYIVLPETTLDDALVLAKQFHHKACAALPAGIHSELLIGISARVGRSVHAMRLINEADRALGKAGEEPQTPIVAFRADPEKYKEFLARTEADGAIF